MRVKLIFQFCGDFEIFQPCNVHVEIAFLVWEDCRVLKLPSNLVNIAGGVDVIPHYVPPPARKVSGGKVIVFRSKVRAGRRIHHDFPPVGGGGGNECLPGEITVEHDLGEEEPNLVGGLEDIEVGGE